MSLFGFVLVTIENQREVLVHGARGAKDPQIFPTRFGGGNLSQNTHLALNFLLPSKSHIETLFIIAYKLREWVIHALHISQLAFLSHIN